MQRKSIRLDSFIVISHVGECASPASTALEFFSLSYPQVGARKAA
jgi:hypothetical protein